jgi:hypothetical protein
MSSEAKFARQGAARSKTDVILSEVRKANAVEGPAVNSPTNQCSRKQSSPRALSQSKNDVILSERSESKDLRLTIPAKKWVHSRHHSVY